MTNDVFCKIISGEIPAEFVYKDDEVVVFKDINPQAPVHLLVVLVGHIDGIGDFVQHDGPILGKMVRVAHRVAEEQGLNKGYRLIINEGEDGGKLVPHLHLHLLGGKSLGPKLIAED